jgi:hypothetical protein
MTKNIQQRKEAPLSLTPPHPMTKNIQPRTEAEETTFA